MTYLRESPSDRPSLSLDDLPADLRTRVVDRMRDLAPEMLAVLVTGSYASGRAATSSDLDVTGVYAQDPNMGYRTWFEERPGRPLHVSADAISLAARLRLADEPADWSLGFPTREPALFLWSTDRARDALGEPPILLRPAGSPELEDFVEGAMKARRAAARGDGIGTRWHAQHMAHLAPSLLIPLNPERRVCDRRDALDAALTPPLAPLTYALDLAVCLGLDPVDDAAVARSAARLSRVLVAFLRERKPDIDAQPWLAQYLADGTLERLLRLE